MTDIGRKLPLALLGFAAFSGSAFNAPKSKLTQADKQVDLMPEVFRSCYPCHAKGNVGPFAFETPADLEKHKSLIIEQVIKGTMPPPIPKSQFGVPTQFHKLGPDALQAFQNWAVHGKPIAAKSTAVPPKRSSPSETVNSSRVEPSRHTIAPEGAPYWRNYVIEVPKGMKYLQGWSVVPDSPQAFRSAKVAVLNNKKVDARDGLAFAVLDTPSAQVIGSWSPGYKPWRLPDPYAIQLQEGARLIIQVQFQPLGKALSGGFKLNLVTPKSNRTLEPELVTLQDQNWSLKAYEDEVRTLRYRSARRARVHSVVPEARFYAIGMKLRTEGASQTTTEFLEFNPWSPYSLGNISFTSELLTLQQGSQLVAAVDYANNERCQINEGKTPQHVTVGPKLEDEACRLHLVLLPF